MARRGLLQLALQLLHLQGPNGINAEELRLRSAQLGLGEAWKALLTLLTHDM